MGMSALHPAFGPLHARLCGVQEELREVADHTLLALYPVELESYEPFLRGFYAASTADAQALFRTVEATPISTVEQALLGPFIPTGMMRTVLLPQQAEALVAQLQHHDMRHTAQVALKRQLIITVRTLLVLSQWDEEAFASSQKSVQRLFMDTVGRLSAFFEVQP
jgi:hypothetical protein